MTRTLIIKNLCILVFLVSGLSQMHAQDIHFSQFHSSPLNLSPALAGVFNGDMRFTGSYRSQWQSVPVPYMTFSGAFDLNHYNYKNKNSVFGAGAVFYYDRAGEGDLSLAQFSVSGAYTRRLSERNFLTAGVMGSLSQRSFDMDKLSFDMQFDGEIFDPGRGSGEDFINSQIFYADLAVGLNWHHQLPKKRLRMDFGAAMFHINQPEVSFNKENSVDLDHRFAIYGIGEFMLSQNLDFLFRAMGQLQGAYKEYLVGAAGRIHISQTKTREIALALGLNYRIQDALIPNITLDYRSWRLGLSYDANTSGFTEATDFRGGPEVSVIYYYSRVKPLETYKACPIF